MDCTGETGTEPCLDFVLLSRFVGVFPYGRDLDGWCVVPCCNVREGDKGKNDPRVCCRCCLGRIGPCHKAAQEVWISSRRA